MLPQETWIATLSEPDGPPWWVAPLPVVAYFGGAWAWLWYSAARRRGQWRRAAQTLGLGFGRGRQQVAIRGDLGGLRVDLVWARGERGPSRFQGKDGTSAMKSGTRLTVRAREPLLPFILRDEAAYRRALEDPDRQVHLAPARAELDALYARLPRADVGPTGIRSPCPEPRSSADVVAMVEAAVAAAAALRTG